MNVFYLDKDIQVNALYHTDKHVSKMRVEYAQLACTAHILSGTDQSIVPYKKTHPGHPCALWTKTSLSNYLYVVNLGLLLCNEMRYRFNTKVQKTEEVLFWLLENKPNIPDIGFTQPALAMPDDSKVPQCSIESYRLYYNKHKVHLHSWKNRNTPYWIWTTS